MKPTDAQIIDQAKQQCWTGVRPEIDDDAEVSRAEGPEGGTGAYVQAWVYVDFKDIEEPEEEGA